MSDPQSLAQLAQSPEIRSPLGRLHGEPPSAPEWFRQTVAQAPERSRLATPRGAIETLTWGERGRPGLLFVHGNRAHADWWSFIAPFFAGGYRVAALSLAGMGESDWRARYDFEGYADDFEAVSAAAGLAEAGRAPVLIGHSLGGGLVFQFAARRPERLSAAVLIDVGFGGVRPEFATDRARDIAQLAEASSRMRGDRVYPTLAEALARFRLSPPQPLENLFIVDHIARRALKRAPLPDGSGEGWTWKFDPEIWDKLDRAGFIEFLASGLGPAAKVPLAHLWGEKSVLAVPDGAGPMPGETLAVGIPEAHHHVPIDQPLALVAAIRAVLAAWRF
jgi:pimeloyl-ACP methyl ester carboxylesterase